MQPPPFDPSEHAHRRWNPLLESWVLCSPHRTKRPWQGQTEPPNLEERPQYDPKCYLCPGNDRAGGEKTEKYTSTYTFQNDFAAVTTLETAPSNDTELDSALFRTEPARGNCFVICFNPRHDMTLAEMPSKDIVPVIEAWQQLYRDVSKEPWARYIQIFENKGAMMGCSNPHPHGQSWCLSYVPSIASTILASQRKYAESPSSPAGSARPKISNGKASLLLEYAQAEARDRTRVIHETGSFLAVVPYWATWPFEAMILPTKRQIAHVAALTDDERGELAEAIRAVACRFDNLFECSFPYSMGLYQSPTLDAPDAEFAQLHISFQPPLLRSASVRKFLVGFELFAEAQRDITPEQAAARLRDCDADKHYKHKQ